MNLQRNPKKFHQPIVAGYTEHGEELLAEGNFGSILQEVLKPKKDFETVLNERMKRFHDVSKLLFFSSEQLGLVMSSSLINLHHQHQIGGIDNIQL